MKNSVKSSFYFSAYPLKVLDQHLSEKPIPDQSPLRAVLTGTTRSINRVRVFPMINPYREADASASTAVSK
jgi:hypothetical protein